MITLATPLLIRGFKAQAAVVSGAPLRAAPAAIATVSTAIAVVAEFVVVAAGATARLAVLAPVPGAVVGGGSLALTPGMGGSCFSGWATLPRGGRGPALALGPLTAPGRRAAIESAAPRPSA